MRKSRARVSAAITRAATTSAAAVLQTFDGSDCEVPLHTTHSRWFHTRVTTLFGTLFLFLFGTSSLLTRWSGDEISLQTPMRWLPAIKMRSIDAATLRIQEKMP